MGEKDGGKKMKKFMSLLLAGIMIFSLCACTGNNGQSSNVVADNDPLTKDDVIKIVIGSHASWPYREDWKVWQYIEEGCGATLDITAYPSGEAGTKVNLMFAAPETLPDILYSSYKPGDDKHVLEGGLIALDDMIEYMPNYSAWLESLTEDEYSNNVVPRKAYDGKVYSAPVIGREKSKNVRAWLYRKDIFDKHNLSVPTTFDELYETSKKLKKIYPESYPFCVRSGTKIFETGGSSWKPYFEPLFYYDYNAEKWSYGAGEEIMLDMIKFAKKMVEEKLMPADFMTISNTTWQELITTDRGFIMPEYQTRIDFFNAIARTQNPDYDLHAMVPPVATEQGVAMVNKFNLDPVGMTIANNGDESRIANAAKYVDWFYSDESIELVSWGKEGETYEVVDGKKRFITDEAGTPADTLYGFGTYGTFSRMDPESVLAFESEDIAETRDMVLEHTMPYVNPTQFLAFTAEEQKVRDEFETAVNTYMTEMVAKFILGQEPLTSFDTYVATLNEMGLPELLAVYESAYARVK